MDAVKFFEIWKTMTIALSDAEKGRLIDALAMTNQTAKTDEADGEFPKPIIGREKTVYPYLKDALTGKTTYERIV